MFSSVAVSAQATKIGFVNDEKSVCGCELCKHFVDEGDCKIAKDEDGNYRNDEKMYPFCGKVCGYFKHF